MCSTEICRINMTDGLCEQKSFFLKALAHFWRLNASAAFILSAKAHQLKIKVLNTVTSHPQLTTAKRMVPPNFCNNHAQILQSSTPVRDNTTALL